MTQSLIQEGRPQFGLFNEPRQINVQDYRHRSVTGAMAGPWARWIGYKRFQYFGILADQLLGGCAIAHLRHTAIAFVYVYSPQQGMLFENTFRLPLGMGCQLSDSPQTGHSHFRAGRVSIELGYTDAPRQKTLLVDIPGKLQINARFDEDAAGFQPMSLCTRIGRNGWVYAHKVAAVRATGHIECAGQRFDLSSENAYAHHDFSAGYMRRETFWNWACFSGQDSNGDAVGLNVSCGVNETSYSENCYWHNGRLQPLGLCQFEYDWDHPTQSDWQIRNQDGRLQLAFEPTGLHAEKLNLGLVRSDFKQIFGRFNGQIQAVSGRVVEIRNIPGFVEDQYAKW